MVLGSCFSVGLGFLIVSSWVLVVLDVPLVVPGPWWALILSPWVLVILGGLGRSLVLLGGPWSLAVLGGP